LEGIGYTQSWWWRDLAKVCKKGAKDNWFDGRIKWIVRKEKREVMGGYLDL